MHFYASKLNKTVLRITTFDYHYGNFKLLLYTIVKLLMSFSSGNIISCTKELFNKTSKLFQTKIPIPRQYIL